MYLGHASCDAENPTGYFANLEAKNPPTQVSEKHKRISWWSFIAILIF